MEHIVSTIVGFASDHAGLAYGLAFVAAALESFPVLGAVIPGTATIVALAALVPEGALSIWPLFAATTAGAIAGDGLSYWLGRSYKDGIVQIWPLRRNPVLMEKGQAFFARHGGKAILIARFTPGLRAVVPVVAGILGMSVLWFYAVNVVSALVWGPSHVGIGIAIGSSFLWLGPSTGGLVALAMGLFCMLSIAIWAIPRLIR
jgi:membrane protein DedA with SNARE-associated domain